MAVNQWNEHPDPVDDIRFMIGHIKNQTGYMTSTLDEIYARLNGTWFETKETFMWDKEWHRFLNALSEFATAVQRELDDANG